MTETVRLPALLLMISYAATVFSANRLASDAFWAVKPATIVESNPTIRYSVGLWLLALLRILAELLLINGRGLKAKALGDPAVQGPEKVRLSLTVLIDAGLTSLISLVFLFSFCVVGGISSKLDRRWIAGIIVYHFISPWQCER